MRRCAGHQVGEILWEVECWQLGKALFGVLGTYGGVLLGISGSINDPVALFEGLS